MNKDTLIGVLGALVLVAAMTGVFFYERGQFDEYTVTWEPDEKEILADMGGPLSPGNTHNDKVNAGSADVLISQLVVEVRWDQNPDDVFHVKAVAENGTGHQAQATGGRVVLVVPVQPQPADASYADRSPDGAIDQAWTGIGQDRQKDGFGVWDLQTTLVKATRPNEIPLMDDEEGENTYHLRVTEHHWVPVVQGDP